MPDLNDQWNPDRNEKRHGEMRMPPPRAFLMWIGIFAVAVVFFLMQQNPEPTP